MQVQADGGLHEETEQRLEPIGTLQIHELTNNIDTKPKCRHLKKIDL
jgi:hypothetical protein